MNNYDYLPEIHRPGGLRPRHDDFIPGFRWILRWWLARPLADVPYLLYGNQQYWIRNEYPYQEIIDISWDNIKFKWEYAPKPIPRPGEWQLSIVPAKIMGLRFCLPYFAITTKSGRHFRIGLGRLSDDFDDVEKKTRWYCELFPLAYKKFRGKKTYYGGELRQ